MSFLPAAATTLSQKLKPCKRRLFKSEGSQSLYIRGSLVMPRNGSFVSKPRNLRVTQTEVTQPSVLVKSCGSRGGGRLRQYVISYNGGFRCSHLFALTTGGSSSSPFSLRCRKKARAGPLPRKDDESRVDPAALTGRIRLMTGYILKCRRRASTLPARECVVAS